MRVISYFYPSTDYRWNIQNWKFILILLAKLHSVTFINDFWRWQEVGDRNCTNNRSTCKLTLHLAHLWSHGNAISEIFVPHYKFRLDEPSIVRWDLSPHNTLHWNSRGSSVHSNPSSLSYTGATGCCNEGYPFKTHREIQQIWIRYITFYQNYFVLLWFPGKISHEMVVKVMCDVSLNTHELWNSQL